MKTAKFFTFILIGFLLLACNLGGIVQTGQNTATGLPSASASESQPVIESSPTVGLSADQTPVVLDPCTLVTTAEAEVILAELSNPPQPMNGACTFSNAKDALYMVSVAAAQDKETIGILEGQTMLVGFAGGKLDDARMTRIKTMAAALDHKGVFSELAAAAGSLPTLKARLVEDDDFDLIYWALITAQTRRQGAFVAARGQTLVNINLVVTDSQLEESMLAASKSLAEKIFARLPSKFTLPKTPAAPTPPVPTPTPTLVGGMTIPQVPTPVPTIVPPSAPTLVPSPTYIRPTPVPQSGPTLIPQSGPTLVPSPTLVN